VLTGRVTTSGALAVRAVTDDSTVTAAQVRSDGSFTLALPAGARYRLEVLTTSGVRHVLSHQSSGLRALSFEVCQPTDPFDCGGIGDGSTGGGMGSGGGGMQPPCDANGNCPPPPCMDPSDPNCKPPPPPPCMDPSDPSCVPPPPPPCTDPTDPLCKCDANGVCPPPTCDPADAMCPPPPPPPCADPSDPNCMPPPPPCADPTDPYCKCDANGVCPPPTCDPADAMCPPPPPPPCADPTDPETCKDPCMIDPASCGCSMEDPNCWPPPEPPSCDAAGNCDPGMGGMAPDHPPGDFGCQGMPSQ
jgi:hypothetical protein